MSLKCGIVGLPNVGKSSLFNTLTKSEVPSENYPFCTIDPNVGIVEVPDPRLQILQKIVNTKNVVPAVVEFVDIAGLVKGASKGEGLGNQFLNHIRQVDAILHVVRYFGDEDVTHVDGSVDPMRDLETIESELILSDLDLLLKAQERVQKVAKSGDKEAVEKLEAIEAAIHFLDELKPVRHLNSSQTELLAEYHLLTLKPVLYLINVDESQYQSNEKADVLISFEKLGQKYLTICAKLEQELSQLNLKDQQLFLSEMGLSESGLNRLVRYVYQMLGLHTFFTAGEKEVRAWMIRQGDSALEAAAKIHTDFAKGFIRAETVRYNQFVQYGGWSGAKSNGDMIPNGKDYIVHDGDIMNFLFNV